MLVFMCCKGALRMRKVIEQLSRKVSYYFLKYPKIKYKFSHTQSYIASSLETELYVWLQQLFLSDRVYM